MLAIDDSTSSDWARLIRGTASMAIAVTPAARSFSTSSGLSAGASSETSTVPGRNREISSSLGALTLWTTSEPHACSASTTRAPAAAYASSEKLATAPAPALDDDVVAEADELTDGLGRRSDPCLTGATLSWDTDLHDGSFALRGRDWFPNLEHDRPVTGAEAPKSHVCRPLRALSLIVGRCRGSKVSRRATSGSAGGDRTWGSGRGGPRPPRVLKAYARPGG